MPTDLILPSAAEVRLVAQQLLPTLTLQDPIFTHCPITEDDTDILMWEQEDWFTGLQGVRGLNGQAGRVKQVGATRYISEPGAYGEEMLIDERELTKRRKWGTFGDVIDATDLTMDRTRQLVNRRINRIRQIAWSLFATGTYSVAQTIGGQSFIMATDTYSFQTFGSTVAWTTYATATPLADFRAVQLLHRGYSVSFSSDAKAYMNQGTFNNLAKNTNSDDLYGRRTAGLGTFESLGQINTLLAGDNLPQIVIQDDTYRDDSGTVQLFVPDNVVVVIGKRDLGDPIAEYRMTRNASNPGMAPGPFMSVTELNPGRMPRQVLVSDGHNGGPVVFQPNAVVIMSV